MGEGRGKDGQEDRRTQVKERRGDWRTEGDRRQEKTKRREDRSQGGTGWAGMDGLIG